MSSPAQSTPGREAVASLSAVQVFDQDGQKLNLGQLIHGKRVCLIFIRHFCTCSAGKDMVRLMDQGCLNCQAYVRGIGERIPPSSLPEDTQSKSLLVHYIEVY
jgi:hypothetical protein